jgi:WD40 repeat protein
MNLKLWGLMLSKIGNDSNEPLNLPETSITAGNSPSLVENVINITPNKENNTMKNLNSLVEDYKPVPDSQRLNRLMDITRNRPEIEQQPEIQSSIIVPTLTQIKDGIDKLVEMKSFDKETVDSYVDDRIKIMNLDNESTFERYKSMDVDIVDNLREELDRLLEVPQIDSIKTGIKDGLMRIEDILRRYPIKDGDGVMKLLNEYYVDDQEIDNEIHNILSNEDF